MREGEEKRAAEERKEERNVKEKKVVVKPSNQLLKFMIPFVKK